MICGECPNCDAHVMTPYGGPGVFSRETCESCGKTYWLRHSIVDPVAYTEAGFAEEWEVDTKTKTVHRRSS